MNYNDLHGLVKQRRSIRHFKQKTPSDDEIRKIIEVARWAPSASNSQPWTFVAVTDEDLKEKLFNIVGKPEQIPVVPDPIKEARIAGMRRSFMNGALIFIFNDVRIGNHFKGKLNDSSLANVLFLIHLAAASMGLGAQYVGQFCIPRNEAKVKELFGIPEELQMYYMAAVGYPAKKPGPRPIKEISEILHLNTFDKSKFLNDEEIKEYLRETIRY